MRHPVSQSLLIVAVISSALGACADKPAPATSIESTNFVPALAVDLAASTKADSGMYYKDLVVGTGPEVAPGQKLTMKYTGWLANGTEFDSGTYPFRLGAQQVIGGWDLGVLGMKVGGRRQLIIPPALGYGKSGSGPIPPNAVLVFDVELISAEP